MPQTIETPAGPAEFPDGMPMSQIEAVLQKQFPATHATPDQLKAAIIQADKAGDTESAQRFAEMYKQAVAQPQSRSLLGAAFQGVGNLPSHVAQAWHAATVDAPNAAIALATDPRARAAAGQAFDQTAQNVRDTVGGYVQQIRNLSPPSARGTAPAMSTAPAQAMERGVVGRYGVNVDPARLAQALNGDVGQPNLNAYNTFKTDLAEHPLSVALAAAPAMVKAARIAAPGMRAALDAAAPAVGRVAPAVQGTVRGTGQRIAGLLDAGATPAAEAVRTSALAKVMAQQQAAAQAAADASTARAADAQLRHEMEIAAWKQAVKGVGVSDVPQAQALVARLKAKLAPTGAVVTMPTADQARAYQAIVDTLSPGAKGQKPSLEMVSNLRRQLADAAYGGSDPQGFGAIGKLDKRDLVEALHGIEAEYTGGASEPVRTNWRAAMTASEQADEAEKLRNTFTVQAAQLEELKPLAAAEKAKEIVESMAKRGQVSDADYREFLGLANAATTAKGKAAFRRRVAVALAAAPLGYEAARIGGKAVGVLP